MIPTDVWADQIVEHLLPSLTQGTAFPRATYRLQFLHDRLTFKHAAEIVPYLARLGISHVYASPFLRAREGTMHGYDVVDHSQLHPDFGTEEDFDGYVQILHQHQMGQILDIVPNHMGVAGNENAWWNDVLENGPSSPYSHYFDIDWRPLKAELRNRLLLPLLGEQYGATLESGKLQIEFQERAFYLNYYETSLPLEPRSYAQILSHRLDELKERLLEGADDLQELESIITALDYLPKHSETDSERVAERQREKEVIKRRLGDLMAESAVISEFVAENITIFNGDPSNPQSFNLLDELLEAQVYRLSHWKAAGDEINYRRFFDINELAALSMEEPDVFHDAHRFVMELLVQGKINGLRIDHIDGLYDPAEYLWRLQWTYIANLGRSVYESLKRSHAKELVSSGVVTKSPDASATTLVAPNGNENGADVPAWDDVKPAVVARLWTRLGGPPPWGLFPHTNPAEAVIQPDHATAANSIDAGSADSAIAASWNRRMLPLYVLVEKILEHDEDLPREWPVAGTSGYDFLNLVGSLFVDPGGLDEVTKYYQRFTSNRTTLRETVYRSKRLVLHVAMASELQLLAARLNRLSEQHRRYRDFTLNNLRTVLREILSCFPIYRTYITSAGVSERDRKFIHMAVARAKRRNPAIDADVFDFVRDTLLLEQPPELDTAGRLVRQFFVGRFQQVTSPVTAKGVEDTAFYRCFPLSSLNEVGGSPDQPPKQPEDFHQDNRLRATHRPASLLCSTTHDTKRSEDVRARITVLSEIPRPWRAAVATWARLNRKHRRSVFGEAAPTRNDEYLFYQSLVGIWPLEPPDHEGHQELIERLQGYMQKAIHEAKVHTSWINPDSDYDEAVRHFVAAALEDVPHNRFLPDFRAFHEQIVDWGLYTALAQLTLKLGSPGVPDIYQGQELWDFSLVDPDNRRFVDFASRDWLLKEVENAAQDPVELQAFAQQLGRAPKDNRNKLLVTWTMLQFRRQHPALWMDGEYRPLTVSGAKAQHVCAFAWIGPSSGVQQDRTTALVITPRLVVGLTQTSGDQLRSSQAPLGEEVWQDTSIELGDLQPGLLKNQMTGATLQPQSGRLFAAEIFADYPVALLATT